MTNRMRMALTIYYTAFHPVYLPDLVRKGIERERFSQMVRKFPEFHSERKKRTTSGGCPHFRKVFPENCLSIQLTSNRNFRNFQLNCKHGNLSKIFFRNINFVPSWGMHLHSHKSKCECLARVWCRFIKN